MTTHSDPPPAPALDDIVTPGAWCADDQEGATGRTIDGVRMRCTLASGEDQPRWRAIATTTTVKPTVRVTSAPRTLDPQPA